MRVSENTRIIKLLSQMQHQQEKLMQGQLSIYSGQKIEKVSEDPAVASRVFQHQEAQGVISQHQRNANFAEGVLEGTHSTLRKLQELFVNFQEKVILAKDPTQKSKDSYLQDLEQNIENFVGLANGKFLSSHLFSGTKTDQIPFKLTRDDSGKITQIVYQGAEEGDSEAQVSIGPNVEISPYCNPSENKKLEALMKHMIEVRDALKDSRPQEVPQETLLEDENQLISVLSSVGTKALRVEISQAMNERSFFQLEKAISKDVDLEVAQTIASLKQQQAAYEAGLMCCSKLLNTSLLNYL